MTAVLGWLSLAILAALGVYVVVRSFRSRSEVARESKRRFGPPPGEEG